MQQQKEKKYMLISYAVHSDVAYSCSRKDFGWRIPLRGVSKAVYAVDEYDIRFMSGRRLRQYSLGVVFVVSSCVYNSNISISSGRGFCSFCTSAIIGFGHCSCRVSVRRHLGLIDIGLCCYTVLVHRRLGFCRCSR